MTFRYLGRGLLFGVVGFFLAAGLTALITAQPVISNLPVVVGYVVGVIAWLSGVGMWEVWVRSWLGLEPRPLEAAGWRRYFAFTTDHKVVGVQYLVTFVALFLLSGLLAMLIRVNLMQPTNQLLTLAQYNTVMSLHGIIMIAVAVAALMGGLGNFLVPLMIGAHDVAFPRLNALTYWLIPPVALALVATPLVGGLETGWTAYAPLAEQAPLGQVLFNLAVIAFGLSSILGGLNFLTTIAKLRAPGMTWGRLPIFVWSIFVASIIALIATQYLAMALFLELMDRIAGTAFFPGTVPGGTALLYANNFWFYSHPAVYIMVLPGMGIILEVLPHLARKPLFAYRWAVGGFFGILGLSFLVWVHHMFVSGMPMSVEIPMMVTTELISIPTGIVFLAALGTIWNGKLQFKTPLLFALGFIFNFLVGGITGIFLADISTDVQLHGTYFVVSHFHYTMVGGEIFALMAGIYYWFPKITGRMYNETLGRIHAVWTLVAFNTTMLPMFWVGLNGMNRRIAQYPVQLADLNRLISISAFILGLSFLTFVGNLVYSWLRGPRATANPWQARTLEWLAPSPPPAENFPVPPIVVDSPYGYGRPGARHAVLPTAGGSVETAGGGDV